MHNCSLEKTGSQEPGDGHLPLCGLRRLQQRLNQVATSSLPRWSSQSYTSNLTWASKRDGLLLPLALPSPLLAPTPLPSLLSLLLSSLFFCLQLLPFFCLSHSDGKAGVFLLVKPICHQSALTLPYSPSVIRGHSIMVCTEVCWEACVWVCSIVSVMTLKK